MTQSDKEEGTTKSWAISLHNVPYSQFLAGIKTVEVRTRIPEGLRAGDIIYGIPCGEHDSYLRMRIDYIFCARVDRMYNRHKHECCLSLTQLEKYSKTGWLVGIKMTNIIEQQGDWRQLVKHKPQWFSQIKGVR